MEGTYVFDNTIIYTCKHLTHAVIIIDVYIDIQIYKYTVNHRYIQTKVNVSHGFVFRCIGNATIETINRGTRSSNTLAQIRSVTFAFSPRSPVHSSGE